MDLYHAKFFGDLKRDFEKDHKHGRDVVGVCFHKEIERAEFGYEMRTERDGVCVCMRLNLKGYRLFCIQII